MKTWKDKVILGAAAEGIDIHKPWFELSDEEVERFGLEPNHLRTTVERKNYKIQYRVMLSRYRKGRQPRCNGSRIRKGLLM